MSDNSMDQHLTLGSLVNLGSLQIMADSHFKSTGMPIGIIDAFDDSVLVGAGWQDICVIFHRMNPQTQIRCQESDRSIKEHLNVKAPFQYKCKNGLWDIGMPILVAGQHLATMFLGQFFYENEVPDRQFFRNQAGEFGFEEKAYMAALDAVPVFKKTKVDSILEYDSALIDFITDLAQISLQEQKERQERERLEYQLQQAQKIESIGRLAGGIAHDYNNMLGVILGYSEMILEDIEKDSPVYEAVQQIHDVSVRSLSLNNQLLAFARKQNISPEITDLNHSVNGIIKMLKRLIGEEIELVWIPDKALWLARIDQHQIDQILTNLCINARDAINGIGKIIIKTENVILDDARYADHADSSPGEYISLSVSDSGAGMDAETLNNLYEPFFTTKEVGKGTGLGLSMVYGAVKQNNGFIHVDSELGGGTSFKLFFPRVEDEMKPLEEVAVKKEIRKGNETILLVEDAPSLLKLADILLSRMGYHVLKADSPDKALKIASEYKHPIHLLMTDIVMPDMNGRDLAASIISMQPDVGVLFMSGYTADIISSESMTGKNTRFLQKPFTSKELDSVIRDILDR